MRTIKFRAWDELNQEMVYEKTGIFSGGKSSWEILKLYENVMQFTGLHDNKGKEIFEGDILNYGNYRGSSNLNGKACNHIVKWDVDNACFSTKAIYESDTLFPLDSFAEIIGNIHEHNFLLDEK